MESVFHKAAVPTAATGKRILKSSKVKGKRAPRYSSNIFAMFEESQIQEFKEAFNMIDQNRDGLIDKEDIQDMLASLGKVWLGLWWLTPHSTIYQLYRGGQFYWWRKTCRKKLTNFIT